MNRTMIDVDEYNLKQKKIIIEELQKYKQFAESVKNFCRKYRYEYDHRINETDRTFVMLKELKQLIEGLEK